jgi:hypothetical protein
MRFLKAQHVSRAALDALTAGDTVTVADRLALPGMPAHIDTERAVVGTNAALHAARRIWHNKSGRQVLSAFIVTVKEIL